MSGDKFYYKNLNCVWNVELPSTVTGFDLAAKRFALEESGCVYDTLQIIDGAGDEVNYCGQTDPSTLRRKRDVEEKAKNRLSPRQSPPAAVNAVDTGLKTHHVVGNTATITFITDSLVNFKGFEIDITNIVGATTTTTNTGATATPAEAWTQIEAAAADVAIQVADFYAALPGLGANSILSSKKVARFNAFFDKMGGFETMASAEACTFPAGTNDHAAFLAPVDSEDACEKMQGLFASLVSYIDSFVCMSTAEQTGIKLRRRIHRQRNLIVNRKLRQMKCGKN